MRLGTALVGEAGAERRILVAPLPSDPSRVVDLHGVEAERLRKLGEGQPEALATALLPPSLRRLLEAGPRGLQRARQALAFAEKWAARGNLPERLAPAGDGLRLLACLPRPASLCLPDGSFGDRLGVLPPGVRLPWSQGLELRPTLAAVGLGGRPAGFALAVQAGSAVVLGAWLHTDVAMEGELELSCKAGSRRLPIETWTGLGLPLLRPCEVLLLPFPRWEPLCPLPGDRVKLDAPFDALALRIGRAGTHPTLQ